MSGFFIFYKVARILRASVIERTLANVKKGIGINSWSFSQHQSHHSFEPESRYLKNQFAQDLYKSYYMRWTLFANIRKRKQVVSNIEEDSTIKNINDIFSWAISLKTESQSCQVKAPPYCAVKWKQRLHIIGPSR